MKKRSFGAPWLNDARLPDRDTSSSRIYGADRPKVSEPHRITAHATCLMPRKRNAAPRKLTVISNRKQTRFWFKVLVGHKQTESERFLPGYEHGQMAYDHMADYASTTSKKVARGWIDAVNACAKKRK